MNQVLTEAAERHWREKKGRQVVGKEKQSQSKTVIQDFVINDDFLLSFVNAYLLPPDRSESHECLQGPTQYYAL